MLCCIAGSTSPLSSPPNLHAPGRVVAAGGAILRNVFPDRVRRAQVQEFFGTDESKFFGTDESICADVVFPNFSNWNQEGMSLPSLPHVSPYDVPICVAAKATMPRVMGPLCVCTPLWQTVFKLTFNSFEVKNAGAHGILDLPCATKLRSWMGYQGWSPWCTCRLQLLTFCSCWIAVPCFPRILRTIRRGEEHPCQQWHVTQTFSVCLCIRIFFWSYILHSPLVI